MKKLDRTKAIEFIAIQQQGQESSAKDQLDCPIGTKELLARFHARDNQSKIIYNGAAAFALMWYGTGMNE